MKRELIGTVEFIGVARTAGSFVTTGAPEAAVDFGGFPGDLHYGITMRSGGRQPQYPRGTEIRNNRQFSLLSTEELAEAAIKLGLPALQPEWLGANLVMRGIPGLSLLPALTALYFPSGAALVLEGENFPCIQAGGEVQKANPGQEKLASRFVDAALHKRGVVGWIERPGVLRVGDAVRVVIPRPE